ncbi:unnamed protein product [Gongylonema pulchrum]|uniref:Uncharacterized protein n=1 Tax=Gongylonema pulchrum TaxID=637853 RepID=A0A183CXG6_9BILA|nr:unnamed protein product [Gongylonema pulchrum]
MNVLQNYTDLIGEIKKLRTEKAILEHEHLQLARQFTLDSMVPGGLNQTLKDEFLRKNKELSEQRWAVKAKYETSWDAFCNLHKTYMGAVIEATTARGVIAKIRSALRLFSRN